MLKGRTGRNASRNAHKPLALSRHSHLQRSHPPQAAHDQFPKIRLPSLLTSRLRLLLLPLARSCQRASSWSPLCPHALFRFRVFFDPSNLPSRQPPPEHGSSFLDMRAGALLRTTFSASHHGSVPKRSQNYAAAPRKLNPGPRPANVFPVMVSSEQRFGAKS